MAQSVVVFGASGVVGAAAVAHFVARGWDVTAVSRRRPQPGTGHGDFRHLSLDLRDAQACERELGKLAGLTKVVYAALSELPGLVGGWTQPAQISTNLAMIRNALTPLTARGSVEHVSLLQGTKAYGSHLHPIRIPSREREPRDQHENFYWGQEDFIRELAKTTGITFTILRPQLLFGPSLGAAMNVTTAIGAYAAMCRELGRECGFPGGPAFVWEAVDCRLLAQCLEWAATTRQAANETFNITNGDVFAWRDLWPALMRVMGVTPGADEPVQLSRFFPEHEAVWDRMLQKSGLQRLALGDFLGQSHFAADYAFAFGREKPPVPKFLSTIKLRQAGFTECVDTEESICYWLGQLVERRFLPGLG